MNRVCNRIIVVFLLAVFAPTGVIYSLGTVTENVPVIPVSRSGIASRPLALAASTLTAQAVATRRVPAAYCAQQTYITMEEAEKKGTCARILSITKGGKLLCAHYKFFSHDSGKPFTIDLYEADPKNIKNNKMVGSIKCTFKAYATIDLLKIDRDSRQKGYALVLVKLALHQFARHHHTTVVLYPWPLDNVAMATLYMIYTKMGFVPTDAGMMKVDISALKVNSSAFEDVHDALTFKYKQLLIALARNDTDAAKMIVAQHKDVLFRVTDNGETCLMWAAARSNLATVRYLVEECCLDVLKKSWWSGTAYTVACNNNKKEVAEYLKERMDRESGNYTKKEWDIQTLVY